MLRQVGNHPHFSFLEKEREFPFKKLVVVLVVVFSLRVISDALTERDTVVILQSTTKPEFGLADELSLTESVVENY